MLLLVRVRVSSNDSSTLKTQANVFRCKFVNSTLNDDDNDDVDDDVDDDDDDVDDDDYDYDDDDDDDDGGGGGDDDDGDDGDDTRKFMKRHPISTGVSSSTIRRIS